MDQRERTLQALQDFEKIYREAETEADAYRQAQRKHAQAANDDPFPSQEGDVIGGDAAELEGIAEDALAELEDAKARFYKARKDGANARATLAELAPALDGWRKKARRKGRAGFLGGVLVGVPSYALMAAALIAAIAHVWNYRTPVDGFFGLGPTGSWVIAKGIAVMEVVVVAALLFSYWREALGLVALVLLSKVPVPVDGVLGFGPVLSWIVVKGGAALAGFAAVGAVLFVVGLLASPLSEDEQAAGEALEERYERARETAERADRDVEALAERLGGEAATRKEIGQCRDAAGRLRELERSAREVERSQALAELSGEMAGCLGRLEALREPLERAAEVAGLYASEDWPKIGVLVGKVRSGRATTTQEALNLTDTHEFRDAVLDRLDRANVLLVARVAQAREDAARDAVFQREALAKAEETRDELVKANSLAEYQTEVMQGLKREQEEENRLLETQNRLQEAQLAESRRQRRLQAAAVGVGLVNAAFASQTANASRAARRHYGY